MIELPKQPESYGLLSYLIISCYQLKKVISLKKDNNKVTMISIEIAQLEVLEQQEKPERNSVCNK